MNQQRQRTAVVHQVPNGYTIEFYPSGQGLPPIRSIANNFDELMKQLARFYEAQS